MFYFLLYTNQEIMNDWSINMHLRKENMNTIARTWYLVLWLQCFQSIRHTHQRSIENKIIITNKGSISLIEKTSAQERISNTN